MTAWLQSFINLDKGCFDVEIRDPSYCLNKFKNLVYNIKCDILCYKK